nr:thermonuclease family protein [Halobacillus locisalis]
MLLIDTPETAGKYKGQNQSFGIEAKEYLRRLLLKDYVVVVERGEKERDKYDRLLAHVWFQEENINKHMVSQGFARVAYVEEPNTKYADSFIKAEKKAKKEELRIWSDDDLVKQWGGDAP